MATYGYPPPPPGWRTAPDGTIHPPDVPPGWYREADGRVVPGPGLGGIRYPSGFATPPELPSYTTTTTTVRRPAVRPPPLHRPVVVAARSRSRRRSRTASYRRPGNAADAAAAAVAAAGTTDGGGAAPRTATRRPTTAQQAELSARNLSAYLGGQRAATAAPRRVSVRPRRRTRREEDAEDAAAAAAARGRSTRRRALRPGEVRPSIFTRNHAAAAAGAGAAVAGAAVSVHAHDRLLDEEYSYIQPADLIEEPPALDDAQRQAAGVTALDGLPPIGPDDILIAVMGITGSGKSTFIKHFCPEVEVGENLESHTQGMHCYHCYLGPERRSCYFVDTPGFDDTYRNDTDVLREVADWMNIAYEGDRLFTGIIYLHQISQTRLAGSGMRNLRMFKSLVGEHGLRNVVLATTMWNALPSEGVGAARERELVTRDDFWGRMVREGGSRVFRQDGGARSARAIVDYIVSGPRGRSRSRPRPAPLEIQRDMVDRDVPLDETAAGREVRAEMARQAAEYEARLQQVRRDMDEAMATRDREHQRELASYHARIEQQMRANREAIAQLHASRDQIRREMAAHWAAEREALIRDYYAAAAADARQPVVVRRRSPPPRSPPRNPFAPPRRPVVVRARSSREASPVVRILPRRRSSPSPVVYLRDRRRSPSPIIYGLDGGRRDPYARRLSRSPRSSFAAPGYLPPRRLPPRYYYSDDSDDSDGVRPPRRPVMADPHRYFVDRWDSDDDDDDDRLPAAARAPYYGDLPRRGRSPSFARGVFPDGSSSSSSEEAVATVYTATSRSSSASSVSPRRSRSRRRYYYRAPRERSGSRTRWQQPRAPPSDASSDSWTDVASPRDPYASGSGSDSTLNGYSRVHRVPGLQPLSGRRDEPRAYYYPRR